MGQAMFGKRKLKIVAALIVMLSLVALLQVTPVVLLPDSIISLVIGRATGRAVAIAIVLVITWLVSRYQAAPK